MGFAAATGIDGRLFYFVPLSTVLTVLNFWLMVWIWNWDAPGFDPKGAANLTDVSLVVAIYAMPLTLPPALAAWVLARLLCWTAGLGEYRAALLSGFVAGLGSMTVLVLMSPQPLSVLSGALAIGIPAALSGLLAAAVVYWEGWKRFSSSG